MKPPVFPAASGDERAWIAEQASRRLSPEEFNAYVDAPLSEWERENTAALIAWFTTRYKTPLERLAYARRVQSRVKTAQGFGVPTSR